MKELLTAQEQVLGGVVFAPTSFLNATPERLAEVCNGCGASGSWFKPPSTIYGTPIQTACIIHDWMYNFGHTIEDKQEADRVFLNNIIRLIQLDAHIWYKPTNLQYKRAYIYYKSVDILGGVHFWANKV